MLAGRLLEGSQGFDPVFPMFGARPGDGTTHTKPQHSRYALTALDERFVLDHRRASSSKAINSGIKL